MLMLNLDVCVSRSMTFLASSMFQIETWPDCPVVATNAVLLGLGVEGRLAAEVGALGCTAICQVSTGPQSISRSGCVTTAGPEPSCEGTSFSISHTLICESMLLLIATGGVEGGEFLDQKRHDKIAKPYSLL